VRWRYWVEMEIMLLSSIYWGEMEILRVEMVLLGVTCNYCLVRWRYRGVRFLYWVEMEILC
jgi:hypothetical protein